MIVQDIMTPRVESISPDATTKEAALKMRDLHIGSLSVMENDTLIGIITDRDICCRVTATGRDAVMTNVKEIMSKDVTTCFEDQDIAEAARLMADHHIRRLAVCDDFHHHLCIDTGMAFPGIVLLYVHDPVFGV